MFPIDGRNCCSLSRNAGSDSTGWSASAVMAADRSTSPPAADSACGTFMLERMLRRSLSWTAGPEDEAAPAGDSAGAAAGVAVAGAGVEVGVSEALLAADAAAAVVRLLRYGDGGYRPGRGEW